MLKIWSITKIETWSEEFIDGHQTVPYCPLLSDYCLVVIYVYPCLNEEAVFLEAGKRYFGLFTESEASANKQNNTTSATSGNIWNKYQARENT